MNIKKKMSVVGIIHKMFQTRTRSPILMHYVHSDQNKYP